MKILVRNRQKALNVSVQGVKFVVQQVIALERKAVDEVSIHLVGPRTIRRLHLAHFGKSSTTDCVSFPLVDDGHYRILGDVFVCPATAVQYATDHKLDPYSETLLYIIHGLLHLLGYDDIDPLDRRKMRRAEKRHLKALAGFEISA